MISYNTDRAHVPAVVIVWWQQAEHDSYNTDTEHIPAVVIVWWQQAERDFL